MSAYSNPAAHEPWMNDTPCTQVDPEMFFPQVGTSNPHAVRAAIAICKGCPVRDKCFTFALENNEQGIWGGTTEQQRARLRKAAA